MINSLLDDIWLSIDGERGLKLLKIESFQDENIVHDGPLNQLATKCHNLETLMLTALDYNVTNETRSELLKFVGQASCNSRDL